MRRARRARRIAIGATAAVFVAGGTAAALTLVADTPPPTLRTSSSVEADEDGASTSSIDEVAQPLPTDDPGASIDTATTPAITSATGSTTVASLNAETTVTAPVPITAVPPGPAAPPVAAPPPTVATTAPAAPQPTTTKPATTTPTEATQPSTITSACGVVVVTVAGSTVRVTSIEPLPGFVARVATDGPETVELEFISTTGTCEIHAELKGGGLDVEVQNPETDD